MTRWLARTFPFSPRQRAVRAYVILLPKRLFSDYGHTGPFSAAQVESTIRRYRIGRPEYVVYALALFCESPALAGLSNLKKIEEARAQIGSDYFGGDYGFSYSDVTGVCATHGVHAGLRSDWNTCGGTSHSGVGEHDGGGHH